MPFWPRSPALLAIAMCLAKPCLALPGADSASPVAAAPRGNPTIKLDRLVLPAEVPNNGDIGKHLRRVLHRESRRANWGAGRGSHIEYRFTVSELSIRNDGRLLRVRCTAFGQLPKGKRAKSHLDFGGEAQARDKTIKHVLEIVARGVITRLAELERVRRGELDKTTVRPPTPALVD